MKLYHGTAEPVARMIMEQGIIPRCCLDPLGPLDDWHWCGGEDPEAVYLTSCYAGSFADVASNQFTHDWAIIEVDVLRLDLGLFVPDERWTRQWVEKNIGGRQIAADPAEFHQTFCDIDGMWLASLEQLGMCAYLGAVPFDAISRVSIYDPRDFHLPSNLVSEEDTRLHVDSHAAESRWGELFTRWCFDPIDDDFVRRWVQDAAGALGWDRRRAARLEYSLVDLRARTGLTVIENPAYRAGD